MRSCPGRDRLALVAMSLPFHERTAQFLCPGSIDRGHSVLVDAEKLLVSMHSVIGNVFYAIFDHTDQTVMEAIRYVQLEDKVCWHASFVPGLLRSSRSCRTENLPVEIVLATVVESCRFVPFRAANTDQRSADYTSKHIGQVHTCDT